ncbi:enzymatic polyprotein, putative [Rhizophagus clarus]|uniref:RNA-directed DNA polymerase n=1 Tax=Rhizophagus clarus TaxID=94130 RepID=A0A8H3KZZ7_9GLOM|nr:enzymatic polyprotein, putative [Rhizophagus clarus]
MEYFMERQMDYYNHQELHETQMIVKDKDCLLCEKCYPIREEVPRVFEKVWKILKKFESSIGEYNRITVIEVLNLLSIDSRERDDYNGPKIKKILDRIIESIRYNEQPSFKEKGLRQVLVVIARDCIENNKENKIRKILDVVQIEHKGGPVNIKGYVALKTFKEILYLINEEKETDEELPYRAKRLITELVNEHIEYIGSRFKEDSESSVESYKLTEDAEKEMKEELIGMGYELDMPEIERLIRIYITKEIVLIEGFIDFYLYNRKLEDEELHHKCMNWLKGKIVLDDDNNINESAQNEQDDNDSEYIRLEDSFENLGLEEKVTKLLKWKRETMGIASEEEIRKFLEWGYIESIIMDNDIVLEYRKLRMEGDPYDEDDGIVKEELDRYIIDKKIRAMKRKEENKEEIELTIEYESNLEIKNFEELNSETESNNETSEDEINQELENFRRILRTPSPIRNMALNENQFKRTIEMAIGFPANTLDNPLGPGQTLIEMINTAGETSGGIIWPTFNGREDEDVNDWIIQFELAFSASRRNEGNNGEHKAVIAANCLKGTALQCEEVRRKKILELRRMKQGINEGIGEYARRFRNLLRIATRGHAWDDAIQVDSFIEGLEPTIRYNVRIQNPGNLNKAIEQAKRIEGARNGLLGKIIPEQNDSMENILRENTQKYKKTNPIKQYMEEPVTDGKMDELIKKFEKMEAHMLERENYRRSTRRNIPDRRFNGNENNRNREYDRIRCFKCQRVGHYATECPIGSNNRRVNIVEPYDDYEREYYDEYYDRECYDNYYTEEINEEDEYEDDLYPQEIRTREADQRRNMNDIDTNVENPRRRGFTEEQRQKGLVNRRANNTCGNCLQKGHFTKECPNETVRRKYEKPEVDEERTQATRCDVLIEGKLVKALVDTGAGPSVMSNRLRKELEIPIKRKSNVIFKIANGNKTASLGIAEIEIELDEGLIIPIRVEIIDSGEKDLILETDLLKYGIIDLKEGILTIRIDEEEYEILISFRNKNKEIKENSESENENNEEKENEYESKSENNSEYESENNQELYEEEEEIVSLGSKRRETLKRQILESEKEKIRKKLMIGEIDDQRKEVIEKMVNRYKEIFEYDGEKENRINYVKHEIKIKEGQEPIMQKRYRETEEKGKFIKKEIEQMLKLERIRPSKSPWASSVTLAKKKTGNYRFCVDYRKLNAVTITDAYPLLRIDELLEKYRTAKWFTSLDLAAGFHQVEMVEEDKEKTVFICSKGLYEYNVMPFGLKNAPGTFQRLMNEILSEYIGEFVVVYIDNIMIYSKSFKEHMEHLEKVLRKLKEKNIILKLKKCKFGERNIEFLGHIVGRDGLKPEEKKIEKIRNMERPRNIKEIRSFLGLCSYYRKFVKDFSRIAKPISNLVRKNVEFKWEKKQQEAFEELKKRLMEYPVLIQPDFNRKFILMTDASGEGLGAVLGQKDENEKERVIAYARRSLTGAETNYAITDLECLAVVWAVQHFHKFLIERKFEIITDHAALKGLMNAKIPKGRRARWIMELQQYDCEMIHRSGKENKNADALSRMKYENSNKRKSNEKEVKVIKPRNSKQKYVKVGGKWHIDKNMKNRKWENIGYYTDKEAILLDLDDKSEKEILQKLGRKSKLQVIIIDGVDVIFNTFKRRRKDDSRFKEPNKEYEWLFRRQVVEEINRRIVTYEDEDIIILDKSPYCEYFYQKTKKNAIVIFLENKRCWENYIKRETKKSGEGHKTSYDILNKEEYMDMVRMFKDYQNIYERNKKYKRVEIRNDNESWKKVYEEILKFEI